VDLEPWPPYDARMRTLIALALLLLPACANGAPDAPEREPTAATAPAATGPALWVVKDSDTTIYLFGTVHMLPDGFSWLTPPIEKAFDAADTLVLETTGAMDAGEVQPVIARLGFAPGQPPLADRLPAGDRDDLAAAVADAGVPATMLDRMETWLATMTLSSARIVKLGYGLDSGVEAQLAARARAARKRVEGLETVEEQLGFFDTLPEAEQRTLLAASLDDMDTIRKLVDDAVKRWAAGDVDAVAALLEEDINDSPILAKRLLADRNEAWAEWIDERLDSTPGTVFVAVGTGHLAGKDSLQAKLRKRELHSVRLN
jgi:uncharacterized protein